MRITRIETYTKEPVSVVKLYAGGLCGIGQIAPYDADISAMVLHRRVAPVFLGRDTDELEHLVDETIDRNHKFNWSYLCRALAGVDTAVWDLRGKIAEKSVARLLGAAKSEVTVYGSSMSRATGPQEEAERLLAVKEKMGIGAFKIRVGKECGHDEDERPGRTEEIVPAVRRVLGDETVLLADANGAYRPARAVRVGRLLEDHGYVHFEEPCPYWELEWTAQVAAALDVDIAGGEQDNDLAQWRRMIRMRAVDIVQPDVGYVGGLTRALRVASLAADAGMVCVPHAANRTMMTLFALHLLAAVPNAGPYLEYSVERVPWAEGIFEPALSVRNGKAALPDGPGWGVTVETGWIAGAEKATSSL